MTLSVNNLEGNEIADDYTRNSVPKGRWADAWDVLKSNFGKLVLINLFVLVTFVPGIAIILVRTMYVSGLGLIYPFNPSILYPLYPDVQGLTERVYFSADVIFYALLIAAGFIASIGLAGGAYSVRRIVNTHGDFKIKSFFHGIKVCYFNVLLPVTIFMLFLFGTLVLGDYMHLVIAEGGNGAGAITAYVFAVIATVLVGIYCGWLFAVGTSYRVGFLQLFKNAFVLMIATPVQTVFMAGFALIPAWIIMAFGGVSFLSVIGYFFFILIGFSFILLCWSAFTQWVFDAFVNPSLKVAAEKEKAQKSEKELALEKEEAEKRRALELLAAGRSELISHPIMPISAQTAVPVLGKTFNRGDLAEVNGKRAKLGEDIKAYEKEHEKDTVFVEYNKLFADREKALQDETDKKGKKKKKNQLGQSSAMKEPYSAIGKAFEYLNDDCGYEQWSQYLISKLASLGFSAGARGLDAGCGNGFFTRALYKAGYAVSGMDISPEALSTARDTARKNGMNIEFLQGDIAKLKVLGKLDFITAVNDCLNYIPQSKLSAAFKRVHACLKRGGAFLFDISTEKKLRQRLGNNVFAEDRGDICYVWFNALNGDRVDMDITVFTRRSDGLYDRAEEAQTQYIHGATDVLNALSEAGFAVETEGHLGGSADERLNFICRKL